MKSACPDAAKVVSLLVIGMLLLESTPLRATDEIIPPSSGSAAADTQRQKMPKKGQPASGRETPTQKKTRRTSMADSFRIHAGTPKER